jgi:hypothetical protein
MVFLAQRPGVITAAVVVCGAAAGMMTAVNDLAPDVIGARSDLVLGPAVTFLLLAPGLLGYVLLRAPEHPFVSQLLVGVRVLSVIAAALPVTAAGFLIARAADHGTRVLQWRDEMMFLSWGLAAAALLVWFLPPRRRWLRSD